MQLQQAALTQLVVGRPVGLVEGSPGGVDGPQHVLFRRVSDLPERLLGCRVDVGEGAGLAVDQLAVDHHLRLEPNLYSVSHVCRSFVDGTLSRAPVAEYYGEPYWNVAGWQPSSLGRQCGRCP